MPAQRGDGPFGLPLPRWPSHDEPDRTAAGDGAPGDEDFPAGVGLDSAVIDCALYEDGCRREGSLPLQGALEAAVSSPQGFVWIGLHEPTADAVAAVGRHFDLHPLALEDAVHAHQRPKLETYGDSLFFVLKTARYVDHEELVDIGEVMLFVGERFVVTVRHGQGSPLGAVRRELEAKPELLRAGPSAVLHAVADRVVDDYAAVLDGLATDIDEIETQVFSSGRGNAAERIYKLKREVLEFKRAVLGLGPPLDRLAHGEVRPLDQGTGEYFRDVHDHLLRAAEQVQSFDELLNGILNANLAQLTVHDNQDVRKISAWVAIIAVPTMVFGLYGMNFEHMPELKWTFGYPLVLVVTLLICAGLYARFKRAGWL